MEPRRPDRYQPDRRENRALPSDLERDYASLGEHARPPRHRTSKRSPLACKRFDVAIPSWGVGTGGTRFARFPSPGEPRNVLEKLDDCAVIEQLGRATPSVSLHFPWDKPRDVAELRQRAEALGMVFDAVNSNTFQDPTGPALATSSAVSPTPIPRCAGKRWSTISSASRSARSSARRRSRCGSATAATSRASSTSHARSIATSRARARIYAALPADFKMFLEHKLYEPAFYSTVI